MARSPYRAPVPVPLRLPGRANRGNTLLALAAAARLGVDVSGAGAALGGLDEVEGRYRVVEHRGRRLRLLLAKNPAGWRDALDLLEEGRPALVVINAREADGRDVSWLWDLPVRTLAGRRVVVSGERAAELGLRLDYAEIPHRTEPDPTRAVAALPHGDTVDVLANYTAFHDLARRWPAADPAPAPAGVPRPRAAGVAGTGRDPDRPARAGRSAAARTDDIGVAVLLPDLLDTYSDAGNAEVLAQRLRRRGIPARVLEVTADDPPPRSCELYLLGGGEDAAQDTARRWLLAHPALVSTLADRAVTLAVCAGLQLLGRGVTGLDGRHRPGAGLLDLTTRPGTRRVIGHAESTATVPGVGRLIGFHNHRGVSTLGPDARPLALVDHGPGNDPASRVEGALDPAARGETPTGPGVLATYLHGPVLALNPALADHLLARALGAPLPDIDPDGLPDLAAVRHHPRWAAGASARRSHLRHIRRG